MEENFRHRFEELSYYEILKFNANYSQQKKKGKYRINILSNITVSPIKEMLELYINCLSFEPIVKFGGYDNIVQDSFLISETDMVLVFFEITNFREDFSWWAELLSDTEVSEIIDKCKQDIDCIFQNLKNVIVLFNKCTSFHYTGLYSQERKLDLIAAEINAHLEKVKTRNIHLIDIERVISNIRNPALVDYSRYQKYKLLYSIDFFKMYVKSIEHYLLKYTGNLKKVLVLDCDNTLWKGILGEDGFEGIDICERSSVGNIFRAIQKTLVECSKKGILVCLCSKNNYNDVKYVIDNHPDVLLKSEHIVAMKINWLSKVENMTELSRELNIGLDSFIFVDDSEMELELMRRVLPMVLSIGVPKNIIDYPFLIQKIVLTYFNFAPLKEDLKKTALYKDQQRRISEKQLYLDVESYLNTLGTKVAISKNNGDHIQRIAQLTHKTNQFNFTNRKYSEIQVENLMNSKATTIMTISVCDKFGELGITGVIILKETSNAVIEMDTFLLSCRVLGRKVEDFFLNFAISFCRERHYEYLHASYLKTEKNIQLLGFLENHAFKIKQDFGDLQIYELEIKNYSKPTPSFIKLL